MNIYLRKKDMEGRYVMIKGRLEGSVVTRLNVYVPPNSDWAFYRQIFNLMTTEAEGIVLCGGDFNIKLNERLDSSRSGCRSNKLSWKINAVLRNKGIIDVWRELYPSGRDYTHFSHPHSVYSGIDYFFMYKTERWRIVSCDMGNIDISDHSPIYLIIDLNRKVKHTLWKLNSGILGSSKEDLGRDVQEYLE